VDHLLDSVIHHLQAYRQRFQQGANESRRLAQHAVQIILADNNASAVFTDDGVGGAFRSQQQTHFTKNVTRFKMLKNDPLAAIPTHDIHATALD
jgi:hypothetical protein